MRVALVRNTFSQHLVLWSAAARSGLAIAGVFDDSSDSLDELRRLIVHREVDAVIAWNTDCLSGELLDAISATRCGLFSREGTSPPDAEPERLARTRAQGRRPGRPRVAPDVEAAIRAALAAGGSIRAAAREAGVGLSVVQRVQAERSGQAGLG